MRKRRINGNNIVLDNLEQQKNNRQDILDSTKNNNSYLNLDVLFMTICSLLHDSISYDSLGLMLLNDDKSFLQFKCYDGPPIDSLFDMKFDYENNPDFAFAINKKASLFLINTNKFNSLAVFKDIKQTMISPLLSQGNAIGLILVNSFKLTGFDIEKLETLDSFANIASTVLYNVKLYSDIDSSQFDRAKELSKAMDIKDAHITCHCNRVTEIAQKIATYLGFSKEQENILRTAAILHDIGKIGIPKQILNKPSKLTEKEYDVIKTHASIGYNVLSNIEHLRHEREIVYQHHERYDGSGYPLGLNGNDIYDEAKLISLADAFDAMTSYRPYRDPMTTQAAIDEINRNLGTQFDPYFGRLFIDMIKKEYLTKTGS